MLERGGLAVAELREHIRTQLPDYMVPAHFMELARLPLTINGKVDRAAFPAPSTLEQSAYVGPRTTVESVVAELWCDLLRRERISVLTSFFELGGHSLLATQMISRVRETFQIDVPLRAIFEAQTIATFAQSILLDPVTRPRIVRMADLLVSLEGLSENELDENLRKANIGTT